jgi:hypothetical protein
MNSLLERAKNAFNRADVKTATVMTRLREESGWEHGEHRMSKQWVNFEGKTKVIVAISTLNRVPKKNIYIFHAGHDQNTEIVRIQGIGKPLTPQVNYNIYLKTMKKHEDTWHKVDATYYWWDKGRLSTENRSIPTEKMPIAMMSALPLHEELPQVIDIDATVAGFLEQLPTQNFELPILVPKEG